MADPSPSAPLAPPVLPPPYRCRAATAGDAGAIHALVAACEREALGRAETSPDRIAADLSLPELDPARDTLVVRAPGGSEADLAGWAWVHGGRRSIVDVHPAHRGRGLGSALLDWAEARARRAGSERLSQTLPDADPGAVRLLRSRGYRPFVSEWLLELELSPEPALPAPPPGITVRNFRLPGDERATHRLTEDAFDDWQPRRKPYAEWARRTVERDVFAPEFSPVALAGRELVGAVMALCVPGADHGYVDRVAVRKDQRGRGIASLLLRHCFQRFHRAGRRRCTLWTHSAAGALPLYQGLGMTVTRSSAVYGKALTPTADG